MKLRSIFRSSLEAEIALARLKVAAFMLMSLVVYVMGAVTLLCSCQLATHESHASAGKWEKDTNFTMGGTTHTTGADGWDNATDHNASFQVGAQAATSLGAGLFSFWATKSVQLTQQLQNANLTKEQLATTQANLQIALAQMTAAAKTGQQANFALLVKSGVINSSNIGTLKQ